MTKRSSITMIGGPNTGKSHFTFQLYGRLRAKQGDLQLREMPNESLFNLGLERLNQGLAAKHTNIDQYDDADLRFKDSNGNEFDLLWPDYGGEQIGQMLKTRSVSDEWKSRLSETQCILFFIRPSEVFEFKDMIENPIAVKLRKRHEAGDVETSSELQLESQVGLIELLQIILWSIKKSSSEFVSAPKLGVVLTCWDEVCDGGRSPEELLKDRLPMLDSFIRSVWAPDAIGVLGLSALECMLDEEVPNDEFREKGPRSFGYFVSDTNKNESDLTLLISMLLKLINDN